MMGERLVMQESLFYEFRLEDHVPSDHLLRAIDRFVDCSELRRHLAGFYIEHGPPPTAHIRPRAVSACRKAALLPYAALASTAPKRTPAEGPGRVRQERSPA